MSLTLKTVEIDGKTYAEVSDGKPLFTDDGKEIAFDAPGTVGTISRLNGEAQGHRQRAEKAEKDLKAFEGITDPAAAIKALETVSSLDQTKLIDAGKVDEIKAAAIAATEERFKPVVEERDSLRGALYEEKIGGSFARSKKIAEDFIIPSDIVQSRFGKHFAIEDGKVVATDSSGNRIYSLSKPGEPADFEEALGILVDSYPYKDTILRGKTGEGGGAGQGGSGKTTNKTMKQSEFAALPAKDRAAKMADGYSLVV